MLHQLLKMSSNLCSLVGFTEQLFCCSSNIKMAKSLNNLSKILKDCCGKVPKIWVHEFNLPIKQNKEILLDKITRDELSLSYVQMDKWRWISEEAKIFRYKTGFTMRLWYKILQLYFVSKTYFTAIQFFHSQTFCFTKTTNYF